MFCYVFNIFFSPTASTNKAFRICSDVVDMTSGDTKMTLNTGTQIPQLSVRNTLIRYSETSTMNPKGIIPPAALLQSRWPKPGRIRKLQLCKSLSEKPTRLGGETDVGDWNVRNFINIHTFKYFTRVHINTQTRTYMYTDRENRIWASECIHVQTYICLGA